MAKQVVRGRAKAAGPGMAKALAVKAKHSRAGRAKPARASTLAGLVALTSRLFTRALHDRLVPHGVAPGQLAVLQRLWEGEGLTQAELARAVRVEQPTMARTLDRMARDGLIERVPSREDRRAFNVRLTGRGRLLRRAVETEAASLDSVALAALKRKERQDLGRLLRQVADSLGKAGPDEES